MGRGENLLWHIRPLTQDDAVAVAGFLLRHWGSQRMVVHGVVYYPATLPGFVAESAGEWVGLLTYHWAADRPDEWEVVTLDAVRPFQGIGTALMQTLATTARQLGGRRLWLVTTNDNLEALRFYQRRGFTLVALRPHAVTLARQLKPEIPLQGQYGIPLRDELELEMWLG